MAQNIRNHIKRLEKLSLLTCTDQVIVLLEATLKNVQPILSVDTKGVEPLMWQNELAPDRLHDDRPNVRLSRKDLKRNAAGYHEDYISVGHVPISGKNSEGKG